MNSGVEPKTKEIKKYVYKKLRSGAVPKFLIEDVTEKYALGESQARRIVYDCNATLNKTVEEMAGEAADYVIRNLQKIAEDALEDGDRKNAIKSMELLAKITKIADSDNKVDLNVRFTFDE